MLSVQDFYLLQLCFLRLTQTYLPTTLVDFFISDESIKIHKLFTNLSKRKPISDKGPKIKHSGILMFISLPKNFLYKLRTLNEIDRLAFIINRIHPNFGIFEGLKLTEHGLFKANGEISTMGFIKNPVYYYRCIGLLSDPAVILRHERGNNSYPGLNWNTIYNHFKDFKLLMQTLSCADVDGFYGDRRN